MKDCEATERHGIVDTERHGIVDYIKNGRSNVVAYMKSRKQLDVKFVADKELDALHHCYIGPCTMQSGDIIIIGDIIIVGDIICPQPIKRGYCPPAMMHDAVRGYYLSRALLLHCYIWGQIYPQQ